MTNVRFKTGLRLCRAAVGHLIQWVRSNVARLAKIGVFAVAISLEAHAQIVPPTPPCDSIVGQTVTCTGNLASGIATGFPFTVLNVNTLYQNIETASGVAGIRFSSLGHVTINVDARPFAIYSYGINTVGISGSGNGGVSITTIGSVIAAGDGAHGIFAQSVGGDATVTVRGTVVGGWGTGTGIAFKNGGTNTLNNFGFIDASSGLAVRDATYAANGIINNYGTITGSVDLGTGSNAFNNFAGSSFNAGVMVHLDAGNTLTNSGTLSPGGTGDIHTTSLTGNYVQTSTGVLRIQADWANNKADKLAISGTANLAGTVVVDPVSFPKTVGLNKSFTVLTAAGGITMNGISIANTAAVTYALVNPDANTLNVNATINLAPTTPTGPTGIVTSGLTSNNLAAGQNLNTILGGGTTLGFMPALMQLPSTGQLGQALGQLSPHGTGGSFSTVMTTGTTFAGHLLSCRIAGEEGDVTRFIKEGQCVWARVTQRRFDNDGRADGVGYRENATLFTAGAQLKVAPDWRIGGGIGYETTDLSANSNASSAAERLHLGGVVKYNPGPWLFAASVTGGFGWSDNRRSVSYDGFGASATSSNDSSFVGGRLTAAYTLARGSLYLKPQMEFAATHLMRDGYTEHGSGGIALRVDQSDATVLSASPSLELGVEQRGQAGFVTRAFVKGGATFRDTDTFATTATFVDAPVGTRGFTVTSKVDKTVADVGAGLDLISQGGTSLRLQYEGQFGDNTRQHAFGGRASQKF